MVAKAKQRASRRRQARQHKTKGTCLCCKNKVFSRGLCWACYGEARAVIRSGAKSEQQLIDHGVILPSKRPGRPAKSGFRRRLDSKS